MDKILKIVNGVMPLLTDTKPSGDRKASIGRICARRSMNSSFGLMNGVTSNSSSKFVPRSCLSFS